MRTSIAHAPLTQLALLVPWMLLLASCSSPPKPSTVDELQKRPANSQTAVELQVCRNDLHNTRLLATESSRLADASTAALAKVTAQAQVLAAIKTPVSQPAQANSVYTVRFEFGSMRVAVQSDALAALIESAKAAPLIMLRGRTDGTTDTPSESRVARNRTMAVRDLLIAAGVDPARIRATYQPAGDTVANNASAAGRGLNRRVEIELYRALPVAMTGAAAQP